MLCAFLAAAVHESFVVDTRDHEDHTFCGVMFDAECDTHLPAEYLEVSSLWVRGQLGPSRTAWKKVTSRHEVRAQA